MKTLKFETKQVDPVTAVHGSYISLVLMLIDEENAMHICRESEKEEFKGK